MVMDFAVFRDEQAVSYDCHDFFCQRVNRQFDTTVCERHVVRGLSLAHIMLGPRDFLFHFFFSSPFSAQCDTSGYLMFYLQITLQLL